MEDASKKWHRLVRAMFFLAASFLLIVLGTINYFVGWTNPERPSGRSPASVPSAGLTPSPMAGPSASVAGSPSPSPILLPPSPSPAPSSTTTPPASINAPLPYKLVIPVAGIRPNQLQDTFTDARSEGRVHDAIDIIAPKNAAVLAAVDGTIVRLFESAKGGVTLYQLGPDQKFVFYYAHLDHYADGIAAGKPVKQGETIAYVGDTGNAAPGNYHLHFAIWRIADPKKFWNGENLNPFPLLRNVQ